jgi:hypothetical protein
MAVDAIRPGSTVAEGSNPAEVGDLRGCCGVDLFLPERKWVEDDRLSREDNCYA